MLGEVVTTCPYKCNLGTARWVVDNDACTTVNSCYCPPPTTWNGSSCVCPAGQVWNSGTGTCDPIGGCGPQPADWVSTTACTPPQVGSTTTTCPYVCNGSSWVLSSSCSTTGGCGSNCSPYTESNTVMCADLPARVAGTQTRTCCQDGVNPGNCSAWMPGTIDIYPTNPACATGGGACQAGWTTPPGAPAGTCCVNGQSWASSVQQCCSVPQPSSMRQEPWGSCAPGWVQKVPGYQTNTFDLPTCRWLGWVEVGPQCDREPCPPPKQWVNGQCKDPSRWACWFYVSQFPEDPVPTYYGCGDFGSQSECQAALVRSWGTWAHRYGYCEN
ncbi:MAG: hypothetical protein F9K47_16880 [Burkholderiales bacterium]|nr:MAG: hypothetical protein F9K47_16880 [Burkholderiales bacterium]